jgi:hypothetical protein
MPAPEVALNEVWCCLKREGKSGGEIFNTIKAMRKRGELKTRKQNSPEALRKWAKEHHLPELLKMEPKLQKIGLAVETLVRKDASLDEALESLRPRFRVRTEGHPMNLVPMELLELVKKAAPPEAEVVTLPWTYEDEDYNIAIVMPDTFDYLEAQQIEDRLIDAVIDYDAAYHTSLSVKSCVNGTWHSLACAEAGIKEESSNADHHC